MTNRNVAEYFPKTFSTSILSDLRHWKPIPRWQNGEEAACQRRPCKRRRLPPGRNGNPLHLCCFKPLNLWKDVNCSNKKPIQSF